MAKQKQVVESIPERTAIQILRENYTDGAGWAVIPQVPNGTGYRKRRTADAILCQLWPSRGIELIGVEYKNSRPDWKREVQDPSKAEEIAAHCHKWVVLCPAGLIAVNEMPQLWGLWTISGRKVNVAKAPLVLPDPKPLSMPFLAGVLRAYSKYKPNEAVIEEASQAGYQRGLEVSNRAIENARKRYDELQARVTAFEEASGVRISNSWNAGNIGQAVEELMRGDRDRKGLISELEAIAGRAGRLHQTALASVEAVKAVQDANKKLGNNGR